jgi:hypothetical protein
LGLRDGEEERTGWVFGVVDPRKVVVLFPAFSLPICLFVPLNLSPRPCGFAFSLANSSPETFGKKKTSPENRRKVRILYGNYSGSYLYILVSPRV